MNSQFNMYINKMLSYIMKGKHIKLDQNRWNLLLRNQNNLEIINDLEDITFGKIVECEDKYWTFYLKKEVMTIANFYFWNVENNDTIEAYLSQKCKLNILKVRSLQRVITGILVGYECRIIDEMMKKYLLRRDFNHYLVYLKMHFNEKKVLYDEDVFITKFIRQTADTIENREAIIEIEYGQICEKDKVKRGLKLKNNKLFISEFAQLYLSKDIYDILSKDCSMEITYSCFLQICSLIYTLLLGYDSIEELL